MATVSRIMPPRAAVTTIVPAAGGPASTTFHSSGENAAFAVRSCSCAAGRQTTTLATSRGHRPGTTTASGRPAENGNVSGGGVVVAGRGEGGRDHARHDVPAAGRLAGWPARARTGGPARRDLRRAAVRAR